MTRTAALVLTLALLAAACGSGGEEPRTDPPTGPTGETAAAPEVGDGEAPEETTPSPEPDGRVRVRLQQVATLVQPLALATRAGDPALYVAQKTGQVVALRGGEPTTVLDISGEVSQGSEQGLLGLAFSPDGAFLYIDFTDPNGDTRVVEFRMQGERVDPASRRDVLFVDQPFSNHNGGNLAFGPDGYLYIGLGDGGSAADPLGAGQDLGQRLGKMLRIDPRPSGSQAFTIPDDNPFVATAGALPAIWAFGLRNPWRYSFDRETGDLWIGDVGQDRIEEIDFQPAGSGGGENYGWDRLEGTLPFEGSAPSNAVAPIHEYGRDLGGTVIGGYVYRGAAIPNLRGAYVFGDLFNPRLMMLRREGARVSVRELGPRVENLVSFGEDEDGELYALSIGGDVYRIAPRS